MTIDEALKGLIKEAKETRDLMPFWKSRSEKHYEKHYKELEEFAKYYEQLAEWLTELKQWRRVYGVCPSSICGGVTLVNNEKLIEFLTELTKLTDKYGFEIGGCGCCGSPWVESDGRDAGVELKYDEEKSCYRVDLDSSRGYHKPIYVYGDGRAHHEEQG